MRELPMGTRLIDSTPQAMTMSCVPDMMAWAAKCTACWLEPHLRSMVVEGTWAGRPAASQARRPGARLLAGLADAAADHIIDRAWVQLVARYQLLQHLGEQVHRVEFGQGAIGFGPGHGAADGIDYDWCFHHLMRLVDH